MAKNPLPACILLSAVVMLSSAAAQDPIWVTSEDYGRFHVVVATDASDSDKHAAEEFRKYWKLATGHDAGLSDKAEGAVNVWIGGAGAPPELLLGVRAEGLSDDAVLLKSLRKQTGGKAASASANEKHLLVAGGSRGVLYGVCHFFEEYMGLRWLAPGVTHIPAHAPGALPRIDYSYTPAFEYRYSSYFKPWENHEFENALKITGGPVFGLFAFTAYDLVAPEKYYGDHPEYYSLVNGQRRAPVGVDWRDPAAMDAKRGMKAQLCFSEPGVAKVIAEELRARIKENPGPRIWSISRMDWGGHCECERCTTIDEYEGSHMGSVLTCVNRVAEALAEEFPEHRFETLAKGWSRTPPKNMKPRGNVIIRLCNDECDFSRPIIHPKSEENRRFLADLQAWSKLTDNLYIWDKATNFRNFQTPHPNLDTIQPNMRLYADSGVKGVYAEGCDSPGGEFAFLRAYLIARCMWDPSVDAPAAMSEFLDLYYGKAAPHIKEYISLVTDAVLEAETPLTCLDPPQWMGYDTVTAAQTIFRAALAAAGEDEVLQQRVKLAYLPVQYAALVCAPEIKFGRYEMIVRRPPSPTLEEYVETLKGFGVTSAVASRPLEAVISQVGGSTPPRRVGSELRILENEYFLIWVVPELEGSVIRWRDKKLQRELLQGFRTYGKSAGTLQDWTHTPGVPEHAVAPTYEVADRTFYDIKLRVALPDGLVVTREMSLGPASDSLDVVLTVENPTDAPIVPRVKLHPEFSTQGAGLPEVWAKCGGRWALIDGAGKTTERVRGGNIDPDSCDAWAVRIPSTGVAIINEIDRGDVGELFYYYDVEPGAEHANIELIHSVEPLAPGGSRQIKCSYRTSGKKL